MGLDSSCTLPVKDHLKVFTCSLCTQLVTLDGYVTGPCQHTFCRKCFDDWIPILLKSKSCECPNCKTSLLANAGAKQIGMSNVLVKSLATAQPLAHRLLSSVKIVCPHRNNSQSCPCSWTGSYGSLEQHLNDSHRPRSRGTSSTQAAANLVKEFWESSRKSSTTHSLSSSDSSILLKSSPRRSTKKGSSLGRDLERSKSEKRPTKNRSADSTHNFSSSASELSGNRRSSSYDDMVTPRSSSKKPTKGLGKNKPTLAPIQKPMSSKSPPRTRTAASSEQLSQFLNRTGDPAPNTVGRSATQSLKGGSSEKLGQFLSRKTENSPRICGSTQSLKGGDSFGKRRKSGSKSRSRSKSPMRSSTITRSPLRSRAPSSKATSPVVSEKKKKQPSAVFMLKEQANAAFKEGKYHDAELLYTDAIDAIDASDCTDKREQTAVLYANRAAAYLKLELHQMCAQDCEKALELDMSLSKAWLRKVWALRGMERFEEAVVVIREALVNNPGDKTLTEELRDVETIVKEFAAIQSLLQSRQFAEARQLLVKMRPRTTRVILLQGKADLGLGHSDTVLDYLHDNILSKDDSHAEALALNAQAHVQNGNFVDAVRSIKKVLYENPVSNQMLSLKIYTTAQTHLASARASCDKNQYSEAIDSYTQAMDILTSGLTGMSKSMLHTILYAERARNYLALNQFDKVLEDTSNVLESSPLCSLAWVIRIKAYQALRDWQSIEKELKPVVSNLNTKILRSAYEQALQNANDINYYTLLGVSRTASKEEIERMYKIKARESHPDKFVNNSADERKEAEETFKLLGEAKELLINDFTRDLYNIGRDVPAIRMQADAVKRRQAPRPKARPTAASAG